MVLPSRGARGHIDAQFSAATAAGWRFRPSLRVAGAARVGGARTSRERWSQPDRADSPRFYRPPLMA